LEAAMNDKIDWETLRGVLCNPIYAGVGKYPPIVNDEVWITAAEKLTQEMGVRQFLTRMLAALRSSFSEELGS
jgi:hypothetical protein